jgi:acyl-CoA reductase-like NAD-dependent aldehyde dehydrogenase
MSTFKTISPIDDSVYVEQNLHTTEDINVILANATKAQKLWQQVNLEQRKKYIQKFVDIIVSEEDEISKELTLQMGRPITQSPYEIKGFKQRADYMMEIAGKNLQNHYPKEIKGFERYIEKLPLGNVCILSPWNYPFLTSVNVLVPALLAGNSVILKHSAQTPLVALRYKNAFKEANLPDGLFSIVYLNHVDTSVLLNDKRVDGVFFTGSVKGGLAVQESIKDKFIPCGLELGGKDPAYVRADANLENTVENLVDGAFFNSGQSCCGIERIYVHEDLYDNFVSKFVEITKTYKLGNPLDENTNLGPMVKTSASNYVREQIKDAIKKGAKSLVDEKLFPASKKGTPYLSPHVIVDVNHTMSIMKDESFGPVVGIMKVSSDEEAITLMNDSEYGLTASIWSTNTNEAKQLASQIETGTVFLNRCDYLDPGLAWTGVKNTGRGVSLSAYVYDSVTRLKSIHFKL